MRDFLTLNDFICFNVWIALNELNGTAYILDVIHQAKSAKHVQFLEVHYTVLQTQALCIYHLTNILPSRMQYTRACTLRPNWVTREYLVEVNTSELYQTRNTLTGGRGWPNCNFKAWTHALIDNWSGVTVYTPFRHYSMANYRSRNNRCLYQLIQRNVSGMRKREVRKESSCSWVTFCTQPSCTKVKLVHYDYRPFTCQLPAPGWIKFHQPVSGYSFTHTICGKFHTTFRTSAFLELGWSKYVLRPVVIKYYQTGWRARNEVFAFFWVQITGYLHPVECKT